MPARAPAHHAPCPECGCPDGIATLVARKTPGWPALICRWTLPAVLAGVLLATWLTASSRSSVLGYGGWNIAEWHTPIITEMRDIAEGRRDGADLVDRTRKAVTSFQERHDPDAPFALQAAYPRTLWGYWVEEGPGWPTPWWNDMVYAPGQGGGMLPAPWEWRDGVITIHWLDSTNGTRHRLLIEPLNILTTLTYLVAAPWVIFCAFARRASRRRERLVVLACLCVVTAKVALLPSLEHSHSPPRGFAAGERYPNAQAPLRGATFTGAELRAAAESDPSGRALASLLLSGLNDPAEPGILWWLVSVSNARGGVGIHRLGWPGTVLDLTIMSNPAPTTGTPNTKPLPTEFAWWRGPVWNTGTTGFPSRSATYRVDLGGLALLVIVLYGAHRIANAACAVALRYRSLRRNRAGLCVVCAYPVRPPVYAPGPLARLTAP